MYSRIFFFLIASTVSSFGTKQAFAHGVHGGISGCPVGACGITDWHMLETVSNSMFAVSLVAYVALLILFVYFWYERKTILKMARK